VFTARWNTAGNITAAGTMARRATGGALASTSPRVSSR
jgi:hypothetical protein